MAAMMSSFFAGPVLVLLSFWYIRLPFWCWSVEYFLEKLYPTSFWVFFRGEELSLFISWAFLLPL